jgi:hypothetical protein
LRKISWAASGRAYGKCHPLCAGTPVPRNTASSVCRRAYAGRGTSGGLH